MPCQHVCAAQHRIAFALFVLRECSRCQATNTHTPPPFLSFFRHTHPSDQVVTLVRKSVTHYKAKACGACRHQSMLFLGGLSAALGLRSAGV
jgi:hypothetical protein